MSEKYKHSEQLEDLLRYLNDTMVGEERYKFERELERDPFLQEAFDGLSEFKSSEIDRDIRSMDVISGKKRLSLGFLKYVAYAAGFALLIFAGYWAVTNIDFSKQQTAKSTTEPENVQFREPYKPAPSEKSDSTALTDSSTIMVADAGLKQADNLQGKATGSVIIPDGQLPKAEKPAATREQAKKKAAVLDAQKQAALNAEENTSENEIAIENDIATTQAVSSVAENISENNEREDIEEPINALKRPGVNAEPQPLGGSTLFKSYVDRNANYPDGIQNAKKEFVKIKFKITKTGEPVSFVIERSPDNSFSQEAIRLIQNGPKWSPKIKDGIPVEGEVTLRINFKPPVK